MNQEMARRETAAAAASHSRRRQLGPHRCRTAAAPLPQQAPCPRSRSGMRIGSSPRSRAPRLAPCLGRGCTGPCTSAPPMHGRRSSVVAVAGALLPASAGHTQRGRRAIGVAGWQGRTVRAPRIAPTSSSPMSSARVPRYTRRSCRSEGCSSRNGTIRLRRLGLGLG